MEAAGFPDRRERRRPEQVGGDKGYSVDRIRVWLGRREIEAVIPYKANETARELEPKGGLDRATYRRRNVVERCVGWLKRARRIATRFDKLATSYLAMLKLAILSRYLRIAFRNAT